MLDTVRARVDHSRPKDKHSGIMSYDFGLAKNDYEWKTKGPQRNLYNIEEARRFEVAKANNRLPEELVN